MINGCSGENNYNNDFKFRWNKTTSVLQWVVVTYQFNENIFSDKSL